MNLQQLEYIVAVDQHRHFQLAAQHCYITQATLSMMIKKLEEELEIKIFDRSKQPVVPTEVGKQVIEQAKVVLQQTKRLIEIVKEEQGEVKGELSLGIIPTLAPYLLPRFMRSFLKKYPQVKLKISELNTGEIIQKLENQHLDAGILATPLQRSTLIEQPLFYEQFFAYASSDEKLLQKKYLLPKDIDVNRLWLLEEGHCLRSQVVNLCELKKKEQELNQLELETGSIEMLKKLVEANQGVTILPELAMQELNARQKNNVRLFKQPAPVREISLVIYRHYIKKTLIDALKEEILHNIPADMKDKKKKDIVDIQ
ncbi:hydrogen peroxide-inducible genes activator [Aridibaculum aurantiacum]|uniref:hydrogen peroxide-inducible genes activator n=1 Tax=Aridibaculum aurantiacum TaxID=2810307 RepID=UPI001A9623C4|nr:hydrogen peroxide-inducible genes activator [Aridibaculum aurantiacum]